MKSFYLLLISIIGISQAAPVTWGNLIESAQQDPAVLATQKKVALLKQGPKQKLWDDLEFKYDADGLGFLEHNFEFRMKPPTWGENSANKRYWTSLEQYHVAQAKDVISEVLYERYALALRYLAHRAENQIHQSIYLVNQDRIQVLLALSGSDRFNPSDLVEAQERDAELKAKHYETENTLREISLRLQAWVPNTDTVSFDSTWLPTVEEIQTALLAKPPVVDSTYPQLCKAARKLDAGKARLNLESVSDQSVLKYVGVGYKWTIAKKEYDYVNNILTDQLIRKEDNSRLIDRWSIGAGIRIPIFDSKGDDLARRQVDLLDRESDYLAEKHSLEQHVSKIREEIGALLQQRQVIQEFVRQVDAGSLFKDFAVHAGTDPLLLLKARESSLQSALRSTRMEFEIYNRYLALLQSSGVLAKEGIQNHLKLGLNP